MTQMRLMQVEEVGHLSRRKPRIAVLSAHHSDNVKIEFLVLAHASKITLSCAESNTSTSRKPVNTFGFDANTSSELNNIREWDDSQKLAAILGG